MTAIPPHDEGVHTPTSLPPEDCDRMLAAVADGLARGDHGLSQLLRVAAAPAQRGELLGRGTVLAAYQDRYRERSPRNRRPLWPGAVVLKAAALFILAASGAAAAATAAAMSTPMFTAAQPQAAPENRRPAGEILPSARPTPSPTSDSVPGQALRDLCVTYRNLAAKDRGKVLQGATFTRLVAAAGGTRNVEAYCTALLPMPKADSSPSTSKTEKPDKPDKADSGDGATTGTKTSNGKSAAAKVTNNRAIVPGRKVGSATSGGPQSGTRVTSNGNGGPGPGPGKVIVLVP